MISITRLLVRRTPVRMSWRKLLLACKTRPRVFTRLLSRITSTRLMVSIPLKVSRVVRFLMVRRVLVKSRVLRLATLLAATRMALRLRMINTLPALIRGRHRSLMTILLILKLLLIVLIVIARRARFVKWLRCRVRSLRCSLLFTMKRVAILTIILLLALRTTIRVFVTRVARLRTRAPKNFLTGRSSARALLVRALLITLRILLIPPRRKLVILRMFPIRGILVVTKLLRVVLLRVKKPLFRTVRSIFR